MVIKHGTRDNLIVLYVYPDLLKYRKAEITDRRCFCVEQQAYIERDLETGYYVELCLEEMENRKAIATLNK